MVLPAKSPHATWASAALTLQRIAAQQLGFAVPEPGTAWLLLLGLPAVLRGRGRVQQRA